MAKQKNYIIKTDDTNSKDVLEKILKKEDKEKLVVSFEEPIDRKIVKEHDDDYFISMKDDGKKLLNQTFYELPISLQQISLIISKKLITGEYKCLVLYSFEYLLTFHKLHELERFIRFLVRSSNQMNVSVIGTYKDNEQSSKLIPTLREYF